MKLLALILAIALTGCAAYQKTVAAREDSLSGYAKDHAAWLAWTHRVEYR